VLKVYTMHRASPYNRRLASIFLIVLASVIIIPQFQVAFAGACADGDADGHCFPEDDCNDRDSTVWRGHGCGDPVEEKITEITSDVKDGIVVGHNESVVITNGATANGNIEVNGGTLVVKEGSTVNGNILSIGGTIKIEGGSTIKGNVQIKVSGAGGVLEIKDVTLFGNIESQNLNTLTIMNINLGGNIKSENNYNVTITGNTVSGNIEIKDTSGSCTETGNNVNGSIDGCP